MAQGVHGKDVEQDIGKVFTAYSKKLISFPARGVGNRANPAQKDYSNAPPYTTDNTEEHGDYNFNEGNRTPYGTDRIKESTQN